MKRHVETDLSSLRYVLEQLNSKQTEFENAISSTFREHKQSIHELNIELQTIKSQSQQNQNALQQCSQDIENIQNKLNNNIDIDLNMIKTTQSKLSFDVTENYDAHTKTIFNLENKLQDITTQLNDTHTQKLNQIKLEFKDEIEHVTSDIQKLYHQSTVAFQELKEDVSQQIQSLSAKIDSLATSTGATASKKEVNDNMLKDSTIQSATTAATTADVSHAEEGRGDEGGADDDTMQQTRELEKSFLSFLLQQEQQQQPQSSHMFPAPPLTQSRSQGQVNEFGQSTGTSMYPQQFPYASAPYGGRMQPPAASVPSGSQYHSLPVSAGDGRYVYQSVAPLRGMMSASAPPPLPSTLLRGGHYPSLAPAGTTAAHRSATVPPTATRLRRRAVPTTTSRPKTKQAAVLISRKPSSQYGTRNVYTPSIRNSTHSSSITDI